MSKDSKDLFDSWNGATKKEKDENLNPIGVPRTRSRSTIRKERNTETVIAFGTRYPNEYPGTYKDLGQTTRDTNHGNFAQILADVRGYEKATGKKLATQADIGGSFSSQLFQYSDNSSILKLANNSSSSFKYEYVGRQLPYDYTGSHFPVVPPVSDIALAAFGNKARGLVQPAGPLNSVGTGLGELRSVEGIPGLPGLHYVDSLKKRAGFFQALGKEYLNAEFGWKPFVSDVRAAALATKHRIKLMRQYEKARGNVIRRRFSFDPNTTYKTTSMGMGSAQPTLSSALGGNQLGECVRQEKYSQRVWFSGAFSYYITPGMSEGKMAAYESQANYLLGTRLTPDLLWNLTPWTWLLDWFVDFGTFVSNTQAMILDGQVMWYGYVMCHSFEEHTYHRPLANLQAGIFQTWRSDTKQRVRATPFGFGLNPSIDFNARNWAILAALGITRR